MKIKKNEKGYFVVDGNKIFCQTQKEHVFYEGSKNDFGFVESSKVMKFTDKGTHIDVAFTEEDDDNYNEPKVRYFKTEADAQNLINNIEALL